MNAIVLATAFHFIVGHPQHLYPLQAALPVTNVPPVISVTGSNTISIKLADREALWGLGERFDAWNQRGRVVECWVRDMAQGGPHSSYFAVPFVVSSEGWGLFVNCDGKVRFDSRGDELRVEVPEDGLDTYSFTGSPPEILAEYTKLVGRPAAPPAWVFEPWFSRNSYLSAHDVERVILKAAQHGLKGGVVVLEAWAEALQNFRFEERRYPKPKEWIARLHERGYRVVLWETPSIWTSASTYEVAKTNGWLVLNKDSSEYVTDWLEGGRKIDFRKPGARGWWMQLHQPLVEMGVDGFKTDGGERMPDPWFHNLHPFYYQRTVPSLTFARAASAPCAGNSLFWAGDQNADWNSLRRVVRAGLSAAMSGFPFWGHDIGGYTGTPMKKLYIRWLQLGAFSPIMQFHGISAREPWYYDDETIAIAKHYFQVRAALQPCLSDLAKEAVEAGVPVWRPLVWEFPEAREIDDEFLLGSDWLVAPVLNEFDERRIYLPAGEWQDAWTREKLMGPTNFLHQASLAVIPVFSRTGKTLPAPVEAPTVELTGPTNDRGVVPTMHFWRGQKYEKLFVKQRTAREITLDAPAGFEVLPGKTQQGERVAFYVLWPAELPVGSYRVTVGTSELTFVRLPAWPHPVAEDGYVDLGKDSETEATFFARAGKARLWLGSGDSLTVWLNGEIVFDKQVARSPERDEDVVDVQLRDGINTLQVKVTHLPGAIGPNGFYLRVAQEN